MRLFRKLISRADSVRDKKDPAPLLGNALFLGFKDFHIDLVADGPHPKHNLTNNTTVGYGRDAGHVFHYEPFRSQLTHDAKVFLEETCSGILYASLVIINAVALAGRAANNYVEPPRTESGSFQ